MKKKKEKIGKLKKKLKKKEKKWKKKLAKKKGEESLWITVIHNEMCVGNSNPRTSFRVCFNMDYPLMFLNLFMPIGWICWGAMLIRRQATLVIFMVIKSGMG
jgi:hypothetical protein